MLADVHPINFTAVRAIPSQLKALVISTPQQSANLGTLCCGS
jgi:hypothetical protein